MTENEAIKELYTSIDLAKMCVQTSDRKKEIEAYNTAIQALKDILPYRAIGTVEELKSMKENGAFTGVELAQLAAMQMRLKEYSAIGTIEEFKDLKKKNTPYKPQEYEDRYYACKCGNILLPKWRKYPTELMPKSEGLPYCMACGQKLDWQ